MFNIKIDEGGYYCESTIIFLKKIYLPGHTLDALIGFPPERGSTLKEVGSRAVYLRGPFTADRSWVAIVARVRFPQTSCKHSGSDISFKSDSQGVLPILPYPTKLGLKKGSIDLTGFIFPRIRISF